MKINKKYLLIFILFIYFLIVFDAYCNKVHAQTTSFAWGSSVVTTSNGNSLEITRSTNFMESLGEGKILFNFSLRGNAQIFNVLAVTYNNGTPTSWQCDISSMVTYLGNNETRQTATAICPVGYTGNQGLKKIQVTFRQEGGVSLGLGDYYTFTDGDINNEDYTTILNTINNNLNNLNKYANATLDAVNVINTNMWNKMNDIISILQSNNSSLETKIQEQTEQAHQDSQAIQNRMDQDIDEKDKEAPNQDEYNEAKEKEDNIIESINEVKPNDINFSQDIQATNKIWELTTKILQTNAKVMGLVISILSVGIIKLIMNR